MFQRGDSVELEISDYAFGGRGIARVETENGQYVVFVDNTFPGQLVRAKIEKKRKRQADHIFLCQLNCKKNTRKIQP